MGSSQPMGREQGDGGAGAPTTGRFVVLEHRWQSVHWDFMLEVGPGLRTWALDGPLEGGCRREAAELPVHRLAYLDYEGPVSGGRGEVSREAQGVYRVTEWSPDRIELGLHGDQVTGIAVFRRLEGEVAGRPGRPRWELFFTGKVD